jgi:DNA-binding FadR family transcriptional regulator
MRKMTGDLPQDALSSLTSGQRVAALLRRRIALGLYEPDQRLPASRDLAAELGVGRVTLQQGVGLLADEGLLKTRRGRSGGTFVAGGPSRGRPRRALPTQIQELRENYEFRLQIEPSVARLAAARATAEQRGMLVSEASRTAATVAGFRANDSRFHMLLAESCGNRYAKDAIEQTRSGLFRWLDLRWSRLTEEARVTESQHRAIALAVLEGEADMAERLMTQHLEHAAATLRGALAPPSGEEDR